MRRTSFVILALGVLSVGANAQILMDQIGGNPADQANFGAASQDFEAANNAFDVAALDDFTTTQTHNIVTVEAGLLGFSGFVNFNGVTGYRVEVYTSVASAATSLTGNAASQLVPVASTSLTTPYNPALSTSGLVRIPVNFSLVAGTYWIAVLPVMDFTPNGQLSITQSLFGAGFPNGTNAFQANPGGGFGLPGNQQSVLNSGAGVNLQYRITAAPVPEPMTLTGLALAFGAFAMRRRKKS